MKPVAIACPKLLDEHVVCESTLNVTVGGDFGEEYIDEITGTCGHEFTTEEELDAVLMSAIRELCERANDALEYTYDDYIQNERLER